MEKLERRLWGDLDTICLKALQKEPARRYASAEQLLEDLRRHLAGRPVQARPDTLSYRTATFVRRHRVGVTAAVLVAVSLLGGLAGTAWQAHLAAGERDQARLEAVKAEQVASFLEELFSASDPLLAPETERPDTLRVRAFLERGAEHEEVASVLNHLAGVHLYRNNLDSAEVLLRGAIAMQRKLGSDAQPALATNLDGLAIPRGRAGHPRRCDAYRPAAIG